MAATVFLFNPFAEGYIARGKGFAPVKQQALLADDLANLPQFLGNAGDIVLSSAPPSPEFLHTLVQAGFAPPQFAELKPGQDPRAVGERWPALGRLRPWAWGPDSLERLQPLFSLLPEDQRDPANYFNAGIAELYSKAWSAEFLRSVLESNPARPWLCGPGDAGVAVDSLRDALEAIALVRARNHHRVVVKQAHGLAGQNALRLWEPELSAAQKQWLTRALDGGGKAVVEPWLERELDFSLQLEMEPQGLRICGYTGLLNDRRGQFLGNWAEPDFSRHFPAAVVELLRSGQPDPSEQVHEFFSGILEALEGHLRKTGFAGPINIDAFVYRTPDGTRRLKPIVEINPRYTMGRVLLELMDHVCPGSFGRFRLVTLSQTRAAGFPNLFAWHDALRRRSPLVLDGDRPKIREGALCLNDPARARWCLAVLEVSRTPTPAEADDEFVNQRSVA